MPCLQQATGAGLLSERLQPVFTARVLFPCMHQLLTHTPVVAKLLSAILVTQAHSISKPNLKDRQSVPRLSAYGSIIPRPNLLHLPTSQLVALCVCPVKRMLWVGGLLPAHCLLQKQSLLLLLLCRTVWAILTPSSLLLCSSGSCSGRVPHSCKNCCSLMLLYCRHEIGIAMCTATVLLICLMRQAARRHQT